LKSQTGFSIDTANAYLNVSEVSLIVFIKKYYEYPETRSSWIPAKKKCGSDRFGVTNKTQAKNQLKKRRTSNYLTFCLRKGITP